MVMVKAVQIEIDGHFLSFTGGPSKSDMSNSIFAHMGILTETSPGHGTDLIRQEIL